MFADNGKISLRQIKRLMIFNIFGITSLMLPEILAKRSGIDGAAAIIVGVAAALLFLRLLSNNLKQMRGDYFSYMREAFGKKGIDFCEIFYFFYSISIAGFTAYTICHLILKNLLQQESFEIILILLLLLGAYGIYGGLESRGRVYEIIFWTLGVLLLVMLALSVGSIDTDKWMPLLYDSGTDFLGSSYQVFGIFSWIFFLLFLKPHCTEPEKLGNAVARAVLVTGGLLFFIYLLLIGIFGTEALGETQFSVVILMSMVELPGGFLERLDVLMVGIWFFALYALMDHMIFHSVNIFMNTFSLKNKKYPALLILFLVYATARGCWESLFFLQLLKGLFYWFAVPVSIGIPMLAYFLVRMKRRKGHE